MADRVFEDRLGLWVTSPAELPGRLARIEAFAGGAIRDLFFPRDAGVDAFRRAREAGFSAHLYAAPDGLAADAYAERVLADNERLNPGAIELNIELGSDLPLPEYVRRAVALVRRELPRKRLRLNLAAWKGFAIPADLLARDPALYVCEQNYLGNMDELLSAEDVAANLRAYGAPPAKVTVCYAAACRVLGSSSRLRTLPDLSRLRRGVIFQDNLMVEAGLL